ncbi:MAG TPA: hypothetical protein EYG80_06145 [Flavobacteriaceae bacterium]|nr:hypothetical protein [Flavobacteriaceae bacterium]
MFKLKKILIRLFLFILFSLLLIIASIYTYPWFYKTFMPLKVIGVEQYSSDKKFKAQRYLVPYLDYGIGYRMPIGYFLLRVTNVKTGKFIGDLEDKSFEAVFQFEDNKFCMDHRDAGTKSESERCINLK